MKKITLLILMASLGACQSQPLLKQYWTTNTGATIAAGGTGVLGAGTLGGNNTWIGGQIWTASNQHEGNELFTGVMTLPVGPVNSILRINPFAVVTYVTIGSNLNMDGNGVLSATFSVTTNSISLPLSIPNGGTGSTTASAALLGLGAARLDGATPFPNLLDSGPPTNQLMVLESLAAGQQFTSIGNAPASGYFLGWTNTTPGVAWFPLPTPITSAVTGNISTFGWTNNTGFGCDLAFGAANSTFTIYDNGGNGWITTTTANAGQLVTLYLPHNGKIVCPGGGLVGSYHVHEQ